MWLNIFVLYINIILCQWNHSETVSTDNSTSQYTPEFVAVVHLALYTFEQAVKSENWRREAKTDARFSIEFYFFIKLYNIFCMPILILNSL